MSVKIRRRSTLIPILRRTDARQHAIFRFYALKQRVGDLFGAEIAKIPRPKTNHRGRRVAKTRHVNPKFFSHQHERSMRHSTRYSDFFGATAMKNCCKNGSLLGGSNSSCQGKKYSTVVTTWFIPSVDFGVDPKFFSHQRERGMRYFNKYSDFLGATAMTNSYKNGSSLGRLHFSCQRKSYSCHNSVYF